METNKWKLLEKAKRVIEYRRLVGVNHCDGQFAGSKKLYKSSNAFFYCENEKFEECPKKKNGQCVSSCKFFATELKYGPTRKAQSYSTFKDKAIKADHSNFLKITDDKAYNNIEPVCNLSEIEKVEKIEDIEEENKGYLYLQECAGCAEFEVEEVVSLVPWAEKEDK